MKNFLVIIFIFTAVISCKNSKTEKLENAVNLEFEEITNDSYELFRPAGNIKAVLVLFAGYPETPEDVKREFTILEEAKKNNISILYMNYNQKLWMQMI